MSTAVSSISEAPRLYTLEEARRQLFAGYPVDLQRAGAALDCARAVLDLLFDAVDESHARLPSIYAATLRHAIFASLTDVNRARYALFGDAALEVSHE